MMDNYAGHKFLLIEIITLLAACLLAVNTWEYCIKKLLMPQGSESISNISVNLSE